MSTKKLLSELGISGDWEGVGHLAIGYADGDVTKAADRKDGRVYWIE